MFKVRYGCAITALCAIGSLGMGTARAQSVAPAPQDAAPTVPDDNGLADIVVTAQRRSESAQKVPISITAISGDTLAASKVVTAEDFSRQVVGLQFDRVFQSSNPTIFLRGVGVNDYNPASSGAVGVALDEVFLNSGVGQLFQMYDVDRVEVLRGPQGTLYGRNTTGGILNFYTRKPTFTTTGSIEATDGRFNQRYVDAAVGGPLIDDIVAARVSLSYKGRDGWVRNTVDGRALNDVDSLGGRLQFLIKASDRLEISLKAEGGRSDTSAYRSKQLGTYNLAAGRLCTGAEILQISTCANPITGFADSANLDKSSVDVRDNYEKLDTYDGRLGVVWTGDAVTLTSITAYNWNRRRLNQDQDSSPFEILESPIWTQRARQFTQEVRLASSGGARFNWIVGGFHLYENLQEHTDFELLGAFAPSAAPYFDPANNILTIGRRYTQRTQSNALFVQADYKLTEKLKATLGFRYTWDVKKLTFQTVGGPVHLGPDGLTQPLIGLLDANPNNFAIDAPIQTLDSFKKPTWRVALDYQANDGLLLYASYNRGFRSGGRNTGATTSMLEFTYVKPETIDAIETGFKADLLGRTLRINGAAFYYSYKNLQVFTLEPGNPIPFQRLQNADAEIYGGELELTARPVAGLDLNAGIALLHARYTRLLDPLNGNLTGNTLDKAPGVQLSGSARYTAPIWSRWSVTAGIDGSYQGKVYFNPRNVDPLARGAYALFNADLGLIQGKTGFAVSAFVKNIGDRRYLQDVADISSFGSYQAFYNEPRTYGVSARYSF